MANESWQLAIAESRSWTRDEAERAVAAWAASGVPARTFARLHGSTAGRFEYWRRRLGEIGMPGEGRLLPIRVVEPGQARLVERGPGRIVINVGKVRVEVEGMPAEWVATLLRELRESGE